MNATLSPRSLSTHARMIRRIAFLLALVAATPVAAQSIRSLASADQGRGWDAVGRINIGTTGFCTGTLIADDMVLTAAHCLYDKTTGQRVADTDITFLAGWRNGRAEAYRNVARALAHPEYRFGGEPLESVGTDLALLRLDHPIRLPQVQPIATDITPATGREVGIVSYAQDRSEAPSLQQVCTVMAERPDMMVLSCAVDFGASGAPVFTVTDGMITIVSVVSAKAEVKGTPVSLAVPLAAPLARLQSEMAMGTAATAATTTPGVRVLSTGTGGAKFLRVSP